MRVLLFIFMASLVTACGEFTDGGANVGLPESEEPRSPAPDAVADQPLGLDIRGTCEARLLPADADLPSDLESLGTLEDLTLQSVAKAVACSEVYLGNKVECEMAAEGAIIVERGGKRLSITGISGRVVMNITPESISCERL